MICDECKEEFDNIIMHMKTHSPYNEDYEND